MYSVIQLIKCNSVYSLEKITFENIFTKSIKLTLSIKLCIKCISFLHYNMFRNSFQCEVDCETPLVDTIKFHLKPNRKNHGRCLNVFFFLR